MSRKTAGAHSAPRDRGVGHSGSPPSDRVGLGAKPHLDLDTEGDQRRGVGGLRARGNGGVTRERVDGVFVRHQMSQCRERGGTVRRRVLGRERQAHRTFRMWVLARSAGRRRRGRLRRIGVAVRCGNDSRRPLPPAGRRRDRAPTARTARRTRTGRPAAPPQGPSTENDVSRDPRSDRITVVPIGRMASRPASSGGTGSRRTRMPRGWSVPHRPGCIPGPRPTAAR